MRKVKLQRDFQDCGVTCLAYLIEYYHGYVPIEILREDTHTSVNGVSALDLVNTLKKYHFDSYGMRIDEEELVKIKVPFIAHLILENGLHHFVIVIKVSRKRIEVMDPSRGIVNYTYDSFSKIFNHVVIVAVPYREIPSLPKEKGILYYYLPILRKNFGLVILIILLECLAFGLQIFNQFYVKAVFQINYSYGFFLLFLVFFFFLMIYELASYFKEVFKQVLEKRIDLGYMKKFLKHILKIPLKKYDSYHEGEILKRVEEAAELKELFSSLGVTFYLEFVFSVLAIILLFYLNLHVAVFVILFLVIYLFLQFLFSSTISKIIFKHVENETSWKEAVVEMISSIPSIKHFNATSFQENYLKSSLNSTVKVRYRLQQKLLRIQFLKSCYLQFLLFLLTSYGMYLVILKQLTMVDFLTIQNLYLFLLKPFQNLGDVLPRLYYFKEIYRKISDYVAIKEEDASSFVPLTSITLKNVSFSYPNQEKVLNNVSFTIDEGQHVFLSGKSGSGKSTLCKILLKEVDGFSGDVFLSDRPIKELESSLIIQNVLYLSQREQLILGSIKENIVLGEKYSEERFLSVCRICKLDYLLANKIMGADSTLLATSVSGGEKQRIILARALYRNVNIYILDEPLANVELTLERVILSSIKKFLKGKTLVYISHRNLKNYFENVINI